MEIIYKSPSELKPFQKNPYNHPEKQLTMLKKSMREFGFTSPILVSQDNMVIAGHARLKAAQEIGLSEVPTIFIDLPYEKAVAYVIADNQLAKLAEEDRDLLGELLEGALSIPDFDIEAVGFSSEDIDTLLKSGDPVEVVEDDFNSDEEVKTRCKAGDLWALGSHRLLCGDSTDPAQVNILMNGRKADMVFTDPPYGQIQQEWDKEPDWGNLADIYKNVLKNNGQIHICCKLPFGFRLNAEFSERFLFWYDVIWCKPNSANFTLIDRFKPAHESVFLYVNSTSNLTKNVDLIMRDGEPYTINHADGVSPITGAKRMMKKNDSGKRYPLSWFELANNAGGREEGNHPTQKPVKLVTDFVLYATNEGGVVYDSFLGSGTTIMAAEQLNRVCYGCEMSEHYCDVILSRWEQFTNQTAKKLN